MCIVLSSLFLAALWSPAKKGLTSWLLCALCFIMFCRLPKGILVNTRIKGELGSVPSGKSIFTDRSKVVLFVDHFVIYFSCLSCFLVCSLQPCGHLLGKD